jgi:hypothetical protein
MLRRTYSTVTNHTGAAVTTSSGSNCLLSLLRFFVIFPCASRRMPRSELQTARPFPSIPLPTHHIGLPSNLVRRYAVGIASLRNRRIIL